MLTRKNDPAILKMAVIVSFSLIEAYSRFRSAFIIRVLNGLMKAAYTSETSVNVCQTTWYKNPSGRHLLACRHENLETHSADGSLQHWRRGSYKRNHTAYKHYK